MPEDLKRRYFQFILKFGSPYRLSFTAQFSFNFKQMTTERSQLQQALKEDYKQQK
jgi:hypothetical protein